MKRKLFLVFLLLPFIFGGFLFRPQSSQAAPQIAEVVPSVYYQSCSKTLAEKANVIFLWAPSGQGLQWLDISLSANGFAPGTFVGVGPFASNRFAFAWDGLLSGRTHYLRVNTLTPAGWQPSKTLVFKTAECSPETAGIDPGLQRLQTQLAATLGNVRTGGNYALAVTDLQTGETISVNGKTQVLSGCTINFFGLLQATKEVEAGIVPEPSVGTLISQTIYSSNPVTARSIYEILGKGNTNSGVRKTVDLIQALGLKSTVFDHPPGYIGTYTLGLGTDNLTTAEDVNSALAQLYRGEVVGLNWRDYLLAKMEGVKPGLNYLIASTPGGVVSHKNGFLWDQGWADNDIGIVRFQAGSLTYAYAVSFYSEYVPSKYSDIPVAQSLMSQIWSYFNTTYR